MGKYARAHVAMIVNFFPAVAPCSTWATALDERSASRAARGYFRNS